MIIAFERGDPVPEISSIPRIQPKKWFESAYSNWNAEDIEEHEDADAGDTADGTDKDR